MILSGIEPATFRLAAQSLSLLRHVHTTAGSPAFTWHSRDRVVRRYAGYAFS